MRVFVTGFTGTLGTIVTKRLLEDGHTVVGYSRDEQKQRLIPDHPNLIKIIGDVRDYDMVFAAMQHSELVLHLAALKCVDTLEFNPTEAMKTNAVGTDNVCRAARIWMGPKVVYTSTDKACEPINAYGASKFLGEKIVLQSSSRNAVVRYGNVLGSRGSVLASFVKSLFDHDCLNFTDPEMTRFWEKPEKIAELVIGTALGPDRGYVIPGMRSSTVAELGLAVAACMGVTDFSVNTIGVRPGEKKHEMLTYPDISSDTAERFTHDQLIEYIHPIIDKLRFEL